MSVGTPEGDPQAGAGEGLAERLAVCQDLLLQLAKLIGGRQLEGHGLGGDRVHVGPALLSGEDRPIQLHGKRLKVGDGDRPPRTAKRFMGSKGHHVGDPNRRRQHAGRDRPGDVGDVGQQIGADRLGDLLEAVPIWCPGVGGVAGDHEFGPMLFSQRFDLVVIDPLRLGIDAVVERPVQLSRAIDPRTVGEVPTLHQIHAQDGLARLDQGVVDRVVGRRAGERLHVDKQVIGLQTVGRKQLCAASAGQRLDNIGVLNSLVVAGVGVAAVVSELEFVIQQLPLRNPAGALGGIPFGVDVVEGAGQRLPHGGRRCALGGNQNQPAVLAFRFELRQLVNRRIEILQFAAEEKVRHWITRGGTRGGETPRL